MVMSMRIVRYIRIGRTITEDKRKTENKVEKEVEIIPIKGVEKISNKSAGEKNDNNAPKPVEVNAPGEVEVGVAPH